MSLWLDGVARTRAPLDGDATADVAILGGGIAGTSLAIALAGAGASAIVVEAEHVGWGASGRNAGFVLAGVAENFAAACRRYGAERAARLWRVTQQNRTFLQSLIRRHAIECDARWNGSVQLACSGEEWGDVRESARQLGGHGVAARILAEERSVIYEEDGELHPVDLVRGLARAAESLDVRIFEGTRATSVRADRVLTDHGTVRAAQVVLCTNAWNGTLAPDARVVPIRGQMLATAPLGRRVFERPTYADRGYRYWRQLPDGRVIVGGWRFLAFEEETGYGLATTPTVQGALEAFLAEHRIDAPITHRWAGTMGFSHDGLPYVGRRDDGIWVNGGFTGHGNGFAYATAEILASLMRTGRHPDADLFDPQRP